MKSLIRLLQTPVLPGLFGSAAAPRTNQAALLRAQMAELPAPEPGNEPAAPACGWFDSSHELQCGLEVLEHTHPAAVAAALPLDTWLDWELASLRARSAQASCAGGQPRIHPQEAPHAQTPRPPRRRRFRHARALGRTPPGAAAGRQPAGGTAAARAAGG